MSAKQCNKCGRFKGVGTHVCATAKRKAPNSPAITQPSQMNISKNPVRNPVAPARPDAQRVAAILQDSNRLNSTIKALEIAVNSKTANSELRLKLEATFGKIDWNA
jgi:hypothetical protein